MIRLPQRHFFGLARRAFDARLFDMTEEDFERETRLARTDL